MRERQTPGKGWGLMTLEPLAAGQVRLQNTALQFLIEARLRKRRSVLPWIMLMIEFVTTLIASVPAVCDRIRG